MKYVKTKKVSEMNDLEQIIYRHRKMIVKIYRSNLKDKSIGITRLVTINPDWDAEFHQTFKDGRLLDGTEYSRVGKYKTGRSC